MEENDKELITTATGSPFGRVIREAKLLEVKLPTIKACEGKSDPHDHLNHFNDLMELHLVSKMAKFRVFSVTLTSGAKKWLWATPLGSVTNWQQLTTSFLRQFQVTKKFAISLAHLGNINQKKGESLKSYINCCTEASAYVKWALEWVSWPILRTGYS